MAVVKRLLLTPFDLIVKAVELALFVGQAPVIIRAGIADRTESSQVAPGTTGNLELGAAGVGRVPGDDVDGAKEGINAISGRVRPPGHFNALDHFQRHRHGFPVHV